MVGIIGGGQLARMTAEAASPLGVHLRLAATTGDESAPAVVVDTTRVPALDTPSLMGFAASCDVVTFDHELVDPGVLGDLEAAGVVLAPSASALAFSDKAHQRTHLAAAGLPVPRFVLASDTGAVEAFAASVGGFPVVCKPPRGGYDGRGVHVVDDAAAAGAVLEGVGGTVVVEELLAIDTELAVLVVTRPGGQRVTYPVVQTVQVDGICHQVTAPAPIDEALAGEAERVALAVASEVNAVGVLAVELFVVGGRVLVNEVAPRPHNSGHLTIEASVTSQFENHLRAVCDLPLGETRPVAPAAVMLNVLGPADGSDPATRVHRALAVPGAHVHLYGKAAAPGRKLGHVTATGPDPDHALATARAALAALVGTGA